MFSFIGGKCGGLKRVDHRSLNKLDLRWARLLLRPTVFQNTPRNVDVSDSETSYPIIMVVEDDWIDLLTCHSDVKSTPTVRIHVSSKRSSTMRGRRSDQFLPSVQALGDLNFESLACLV